MTNLDRMQARLRTCLDRAVEDRMLRAARGYEEPTASLADEIVARLTGRASPIDHTETPAARGAGSTCTGLLQDEESMPTLTDEIKTFIVKGLACYDTPSQVAEAVKATFDVEITRQHVYAYDPNASQNMAPRWRELHAATRQALLREQAEIGVAHRAVRLRMLDRLAHRCERHSIALTLKCLEMSARECGGMYENRKPRALQPETSPPATPQPAVPEPPAPQPPVSQVSARPPAMPQPARPERSAQPPEPSPPQPSTPRLSVPLPVMPQPEMPARSAPPPLAVLAQPPQPAASPPNPPLSRTERYLAYVRDRHARDRAVAAEARLGDAPIATAPPGS